MLLETLLKNTDKIAFIGAGNMAQAIIAGLIKAGTDPQQIYASAKSDDTRRLVSNKWGIVGTDNTQACNNADIVVLAVKPQLLQHVCEEIKPYIKESTLVISVAAGIRTNSMEKWLGDVALVRCMPNTPSAISLGASGLFANSHVNTEQKQLAEHIMSSVGTALYVDKEEHIDAVTAVSGSGPAYFFLFIEAMIDAGVKLGLDTSTAAALAKQTAVGAASLAQQSDLDVSELRKKVTSPKGTTEQAIRSFQNASLEHIVEQAMTACAQRANELSDELGA